MKYVTVKQCKEEIIRMDPNCNQNDDAFKAAVILLYGSLSGKHHSKTLQAKTGYPMEFVMMVAGNLRKNEVWLAGGKTAANWGDEENGGVEFWLHVSIALGFIEKAKA